VVFKEVKPIGGDQVIKTLSGANSVIISRM
jgi:hypothetical protein